jgi:STE24 endopeptidase
MQLATIVAVGAAGLVLARWAAELCLSWLNRRHVLAHASAVPEAFRGIVDEPTYKKSVDYTLAKARFGTAEDTYHTAILLLVLFTGMLPAVFTWFTARLGFSAWSMGAFLFVVMTVVSLAGLPLDWFAQFRLEQRFGFNTTTQKTWWLDRVKGVLLGLVLGYPLLVLLLKIVEWTGPFWWLWAWAAFMGFQLLMLVLAPVLIMPLFNKFTPLPEGPLRERLLRLAGRTEFAAANIQVMDGSKRSRHSNAFFTGFGRFRKIVLFDTLIQQLTGPELEAVLAHEIGHYKKRHIVKMLAFSAAATLVGFFLIAWLANHEWFYQAFGFQPSTVDHPSSTIAVALLLFGLLAGAVTFWFSPVAHWWSRRYEYEADAFARDVMNEADSLIGALRKLNEKNLSNLTPHPVYSGFHYSHPTLLERESALKSWTMQKI